MFIFIFGWDFMFCWLFFFLYYTMTVKIIAKLLPNCTDFFLTNGKLLQFECTCLSTTQENIREPWIFLLLYLLSALRSLLFICWIIYNLTKGKLSSFHQLSINPSATRLIFAVFPSVTMRDVTPSMLSTFCITCCLMISKHLLLHLCSVPSASSVFLAFW